MPNYPTHSRWGRIGGVAVAVALGAVIYALFAAPLLAAGAALGGAAATFVGSIYPDIDHHDSVPRKKAARAFRALVALGVVSLGALYFEGLVGLAGTVNAEYLGTLPVPDEVLAGVGVAAATFLAAGLVDPAIGVATRRHRGWTHSVPINAVLNAVVVGAIWLLTGGLALSRRVAAVAVVVTFFLGALIHLGLDGEIP